MVKKDEEEKKKVKVEGGGSGRIRSSYSIFLSGKEIFVISGESSY